MTIAEWGFMSQTFPIDNPIDIIALRMEVRQIVRKAGLGLVDQASFSIATSNLASKIGMDTRPGGHVKVGWHADGSRAGVQIIISMPVEPDYRFADEMIDEIGGLVTHLNIHTTPENVMTIHMEKWADEVEDEDQ